MNNEKLFRLSRMFIAITTASGLFIHTAFAAESAKDATQYTQQINQQYIKTYRLAIVRILPMRSVALLRRCQITAFLTIPMVSPITALMIINLISTRQPRKPSTPACGASRNSMAFPACLKLPIVCIRYAARTFPTSLLLKGKRA